MLVPRYSITAPILSAIAVIENARGQIDAAPILPSAELTMQKQSTVESVGSSTRVEGNPLTKEQVADALSDHRVHASRQAVTEVRNYARAWEWVQDRQKSPEPLSTDDVQRMHALSVDALLPAAKVGRWRDGPVWVVDSHKGTDIIRYTAPDAEHVEEYLSGLLDWLNSETPTHPVLRAGLAHAYLAAIHPFADGNGRVARLLARLVLGRAGYSFRDSLVLEDFYAEDRAAYYAAIDLGPTYADRVQADATGWLTYFLRGFVSSVARLTERVAVLSAAGAQGVQVRVTADQAVLLTHAVQRDGISLSEALQLLPNTPRRSVQRLLRSLVDAGLLRATGAARATRYVPSRAGLD